MNIKEKLLSGGKIYGTMLRLVRNPAICQLARQAGLDFVMLDSEYPNYGIETMHDLCLACNLAGIAPLVRASMLSKDCVSRSLDCGAQGVMVPMTETAEMAQELVKWSKYPPLGARGFAAGGAPVLYVKGARHADAMREGNAAVLSIAQIETARAVDNLDAIAATPGVDVLLVGPNDLSISLGVPGDTGGEVMRAAIDKVAAACKKHGKAFGLHAGPGLLEKYADRLQVVMLQNDIELLAAGLARLNESMRSLAPEAGQGG